MAGIRIDKLKVSDFSVGGVGVRELGAFLREQRTSSQMSLRQLAEKAGVSNPYLSQIERGLRRPSAEVLSQIARALNMSADVLYVQAGILEPTDANTTVMDALATDPELTTAQRQTLMQMYSTFVEHNCSTSPTAEPAPHEGDQTP